MQPPWGNQQTPPGPDSRRLETNVRSDRDQTLRAQKYADLSAANGDQQAINLSAHYYQWVIRSGPLPLRPILRFNFGPACQIARGFTDNDADVS